jgi:hypothetical protein
MFPGRAGPCAASKRPFGAREDLPFPLMPDVSRGGTHVGFRFNASCLICSVNRRLRRAFALARVRRRASAQRQPARFHFGLPVLGVVRRAMLVTRPATKVQFAVEQYLYRHNCRRSRAIEGATGRLRTRPEPCRGETVHYSGANVAGSRASASGRARWAGRCSRIWPALA